MKFFNIHNTIQIASSLFFLVFSIAHAGISLLGVVIRVRTGDNQWSGGVVIAAIRVLLRALDHQRRDLQSIDLSFGRSGLTLHQR